MNSVFWVIILFLLSLPGFGQQASLRGRVTDESGAVVPAATVTINGPSGTSRTTQSAGDGTYSFADLARGSYTVQASAPGLLLRRPAKVMVEAGPLTLDLLLNVVAEKQEVSVQENAGPQSARRPPQTPVRW